MNKKEIILNKEQKRKSEEIKQKKIQENNKRLIGKNLYKLDKNIKLTTSLVQETATRICLQNPQYLPIVPYPCLPTLPMVPTYCVYGPTCSLPIVNEWSFPPVSLQNPLYSIPVTNDPINSPQMMTSVCPYTSALTQLILTEPMRDSISSNNALLHNNVNITYGHESLLQEHNQTPANHTEKTYVHSSPAYLQKTKDSIQTPKDMPLEAYLSLPKELFPTAKMLAVDPNPIIDELCKLKDIDTHSLWLLDLEYGVPRSPVTRPIATYDVKFNSVHCKNAPNAIHPMFEGCNEDFKRVFLFYYDYIVSSWYKGYIILNCDESVENFQSWLQCPMQVLGMCWP